MHLFVPFLTVAAISGAYSPKISIHVATRTKSEIRIVVLIQNSGPSSVFLEETREGSRDPYAINIELLQPDTNSISIGPRRDVPAASVFELKPGTQVEKTITVKDPYVDPRSAPDKQYPIRGRIRATVRYFLSPQDWSDSKRNSQQRPRLMRSDPVHVGTLRSPGEPGAKRLNEIGGNRGQERSPNNPSPPVSPNS